MKDQNWQKWILDAICKIRTQKQRPCLERICRAIRQHQDQTEAAIESHLEALVEQGVVLKLMNKGQISYKDPSGHGTSSAPAPKKEHVKEEKIKKEPRDSEGCKSASKGKREKKRSSVVIEESPKDMNIHEFLEVTSDIIKSENISSNTEEALQNICSNTVPCALSDQNWSHCSPFCRSKKRLKLDRGTNTLESFGSYVSSMLSSLPAQNSVSAMRYITAILKYEAAEAAESRVMQNCYHFIISPP